MAKRVRGNPKVSNVRRTREVTNQYARCGLMITCQRQAIWEMCRVGYVDSAREAERQWQGGKVYRPDTRMSVSPILRYLIDQGNDELSLRADRRTEGCG
jgi:hypothetical protein